MATFGPQMPEVQAHVAVTDGVQDDTMSRVVGAAWEVGSAAYIGKKQADLVGAETHMDNVQQADVYGAIEYAPHTADLLEGEGMPTGLAVDTDLTRIANARRQGRITSSRARALVNAKVREAINDNPMLADALQKRASRFFTNELGGGGQGSVGGNILNPTEEEQLEQKIMEKNAVAYADEQREAEQLFMTVEELRVYKRTELEHKRNKMLLESRETLTMPEITRGTSSSILEAETDMLTRIHQMRTESGGRLNEAQRDELRQEALLHRNKIVHGIGRHAHDIGINNADNLTANVRQWYDDIEELIDTGSAEHLAQAALDNVELMGKLNMWGAMPQIMAAAQVSPEFLDWTLAYMGDERKAQALASINPQLSAFLTHGIGAIQGFDPQAHMAPYMGQAAAHLGGVRPLYPPGMPPGSDATLETTTDHMAANMTADGQATPTALERLAALAEDTPASVAAINTTRFRNQLEQNPTLRAQTEAVVQNAVNSIERKITSGEYNLDFINIQEGEIGIGGRTRRGRRTTTIPGIEVSPRIETVQTSRGSRTTWQQTHPNMTDPREQAQALQSLYAAAEMHPDLTVNGQPIRQYLDSVVRGDLPETPWQRPESSSPDTEDTSEEDDLQGIPWMREEQIQDMEFNDQRIGGEEGSGVGGIEPGPLMERTSEEEVLANVPSTGPDRLAAALRDGNVSPASLEAAGINYQFVREQEEHSDAALNLVGFVPQKDGEVIGTSGVTVGTGIDLGQQSAARLRQLGISDDIISKVRPYLGVKEGAAVQLVRQQPLNLSRQEVDELNVAFLRADITSILDKVGEERFMQLQPEARTVALSLVRNFGEGALDFTTTNLILDGRYGEAAARLENPEQSGFHNRELDARRKREAALLREAQRRQLEQGGQQLVDVLDQLGRISG